MRKNRGASRKQRKAQRAFRFQRGTPNRLGGLERSESKGVCKERALSPEVRPNSEKGRITIMIPYPKRQKVLKVWWEIEHWLNLLVGHKSTEEVV